MHKRHLGWGALLTTLAGTAQAATVELYRQDFEKPAAFHNDGGDVNIFNQVNTLYGGQPAGFSFAQTYTVETLNVTGSARGGGTAAFGTGFSDPSGKGGNFALGMLSDYQDDRLGLAFDVGAFPFFNLGIDVSSIDLSTFSGPFTPVDGIVPEFRFTLYDNPSGSNGIGSGLILDQKTLAGTASARSVFDWTSGVLGLSTAGNTNGNVILQVDLLSGGYAGFDNILITASDDEGDLGGGTTTVPLPAGMPLLLAALGFIGITRQRRRA